MALLELSLPWLLKATSFIFWGNLYLYTVHSTGNKSPEWCSRMVTLLHGSVATILGFYQCGVASQKLRAINFTGKVMPSQYGLMLWSWGYFAFDFLWCIIYWSDAILMLCHHSLSLGAITMYMQKDYTGCTYACTLVLLEVTNPLLQIRWFLKQEGYGHTFIFLCVEVLYLTMFFLLRGVLGTSMMYFILKNDIFCVEQKLISLSLYIVSIAFMYDIVGYILYKYKREINIGYERFAAFCNGTCLTFNERQPLRSNVDDLTFQLNRKTVSPDQHNTELEAKRIIETLAQLPISEQDFKRLVEAISSQRMKNHAKNGKNENISDSQDI